MTVRSGAKKGQPLPAPAAEMDYCSRLNRALPPDIRVLGWTDVADDFHARFVGSRQHSGSIQAASAIPPVMMYFRDGRPRRPELPRTQNQGSTQVSCHGRTLGACAAC